MLKIIKEARKNNIEIIYVRHDDGEGSELTKGTDGFEIFEEFKPINIRTLIVFLKGQVY